MTEFVLPYDDVKRLASRLGISLDGLSGDDYAMCDHRFERFVRPVEAAIELGIVKAVPKPPECSVCDDTGNYECSDGQCEVNHPCFCRHGDAYLKRRPEAATFDLYREKRTS